MTTSRRDPALDIIRGLCIVSMVVGHIADGSALYEVTHGQMWVDGATGFVLLAGLVIGMVQRRIERPGPALLVLARRARLVWLSQVAIVLLAVLVAPWDRMLPRATPSADELGGWGSAVWAATTLRLNPIDADILSLYVVLFAAAAGAVLLLRARRAWVVVTASVAWYGWGLAHPSLVVLPRTADGPGSHFDIATWQAVLVLALVAGWHWHSPGVQRVLADRRVAMGAGAAVLGLAVGYQLVERIGVLASAPGIESTVRAAFANSVLGPGRIVLGACVLLFLYRALRSERVGPVRELVRPLCEPIGRHSLGAYLILTVFDLVLPVVAPYQPDTIVGAQWAVTIVAVAWAWSRWRDRRRAAVQPVRTDPARTTAPPEASDAPWEQLPAAARRTAGVG